MTYSPLLIFFPYSIHAARLNPPVALFQGTMECILAAAICGVLFALFAGQPLNILGSTGPMLVLEMILYNFCE